MKRSVTHELLAWKNSKKRLPLILKGARQVGKTHFVHQFGHEHFTRVHEFNFETQQSLHQIFAGDLDLERIVTELSFHLKTVIEKDDLIFFDEIQDCPAALTCLKYFAEKAPQQPVIAAGSLLGLTLSESSFPVGKVSYLWLGPLTFEEFLDWCGDDHGLAALQNVKATRKISSVEHAHLWEQLKLYYVTGGLPRAVLTLAENRSQPLAKTIYKIREVQEGLVRDYQSDFSKHTEKADAMHIRAVFNNIPYQLSVRDFDNSQRYKFSKVIPGRHTGYAQLQNPIEWLERAGLAYRIKIVNDANHPLSAYTQDNLFKLFLFDVGIFGALAQTPPERLIADDYGTAKGYFAESVALHGLVQNDLHLPYTWSEGDAEVEFLIVKEGEIIPVEVKSSHNTRAKSLTSYIKRYQPKAAVKFYSGMPGFNPKQKLHTLPLYLAWNLREMELL
jgi:predicted AAA+ superfamily ATPase